MSDLIRRQILRQSDVVVVKVGTNVLTDEIGSLDRSRMQSLTDQLYRITQMEKKVVLVSSVRSEQG